MSQYSFQTLNQLLFSVGCALLALAACAQECPASFDSVNGECVRRASTETPKSSSTDAVVQAGASGDRGTAGTASECTARDEVCDAAMVDEDCDGVANEDCECNGSETRPCGRLEGICKPGTQRCNDGKWTKCTGAVGNPEPDEGCECMSGSKESCSSGVQGCDAGERTCARGAWGKCVPQASMAKELCDNLDNDCNGVIDDAGAVCADPAQKCMDHRCVECLLDADCQKMTDGCQIGVCKANACEKQALPPMAECMSGEVSGVCDAGNCKLAQGYRIEDTDTGRGAREVEYESGSWAVAGAVHYASDPGAYFLAHFTGSQVTVYGGRNIDRGITEYSVCAADGSNCHDAKRVDNYAGMLEEFQPLWTSPNMPLGEYTVKGRATGEKNAGSSSTIVDLDYIDVR